MHINKIKLKNFRSFYGEHELDFNNLQGIYKVQGAIGAGKSSIALSILYGLFGSISSQKQTDLISWGEKRANINLDIESKNHHIIINREINQYGQCPCEVVIDGEQLIDTNKRSIQQSLEEYLDMSRLSMECLCIISFNNFKSLSTMNTRDIREFQNEILGFSILDDYKNAAKDLLKNITDDINILEHDIKNNNIRMQEILNRPKKISGDIDNLTKKLEELNEDYNKNIKDLQVIVDNNNKNLNNIITRISQVVSEGKRVAKDIDFISKGICPLCGAPIDQTHLEDKKILKENLANQYKVLNEMKSNSENEYNTSKINIENYRQSKSTEISNINNLISQLKIQQQYIDDDTKLLKSLKSTLKKLNDDLDKQQTIQQQYDDIIKILGDSMRSKLTKAFIGPINNRCMQICEQAGLSYIPFFDENFDCNIERLNQQVPVSSLSTGQSKMIDMICILAIVSSIINASRCNVIFLDELFSNLDKKSREVILKILPSIFPEESSILIVSHQVIDENLLDGIINLELIDNISSVSIEKF